MKNTPLEDLRAFPENMDDVYAKNFERVFGSDGQREKSGEAGMTGTGATWSEALPLLQVICTAQEPLPAAVVQGALNLSNAALRRLQEAVGALFPVREGRFQPIHKSAVDWLTANDGWKTAAGRVRSS